MDDTIVKIENTKTSATNWNNQQDDLASMMTTNHSKVISI